MPGDSSLSNELLRSSNVGNQVLMVHLMETSGPVAGAAQPGRSRPLAWQGALVHRRAGQEWLTPPLLLRPPHRLQGAEAPAVQALQLQLHLVALARAAEAQLRAQLRGRAALLPQ